LQLRRDRRSHPSLTYIIDRNEAIRRTVDPYLENDEEPPRELCDEVWSAVSECVEVATTQLPSLAVSDVEVLYRAMFDLTYSFLYLQYKSRIKYSTMEAQAFVLLAISLERMVGSLQAQSQTFDRQVLKHVPVIIDYGIQAGASAWYGGASDTSHSAPSLVGSAIEVITGLEYLTDQLTRYGPDASLTRRVRDEIIREYPPFQKFSTTKALDNYKQQLDIGNARRALGKHRTAAYLSATASYCVPTAAAFASQRDVIYVASGQAYPGTAIRYDCRTGQVANIALPDLRYKEEEDLRAELTALYIALRERTIGRRRLRERITAVLRRTGEIVTGPILAAWPDADRMTFVPVHGVMDLPLATAFVNGAPAILQRDITVSPNGRCLLLSALHTRNASTDGDAFVACDPSSGSNRIKNVVPEANRIAAIYRTAVRHIGVGENPTSETGDAVERSAEVVRLFDTRVREQVDASVASLSEPDMQALCAAATVHLACHGVVSDDPLFESTLKLGGDLSMKELLRRGVARSSTFVLSACSVGGIVPSYPSELLGFPATLITAGARNVVASNWPVPDSPEVIEMMADFHIGLVCGHAPSSAFRHAVNRAFRADVSPHHWAGFNLYGA
jgi:hypothetical protein